MSLIALEKKLDQLLAKQAELAKFEDWFPEEQGFLSLSKEQLRKMRRNPEHNAGWRYLSLTTNTRCDGKANRRNPIWSKSYLMSLFKKP